ncbi:NUDIX domain-containing protein [Legionella tunisiensis]|uniref:NUDIX domain-containing protein n=1 Tax=Legionella tunisiensis TaxID=1034944 RepID=UPI0002D463B3|nr:NUDIX domain-containing protein [Legionella tunisiensis]
MFGHKTIGARALVINEDKVLLVKHSYTPGWYTIGGAVEKGETPIEAVQRELFEEVGVKCLTLPKLFSVYHNHREKGMTMLCFISSINLKRIGQFCGNFRCSMV